MQQAASRMVSWTRTKYKNTIRFDSRQFGLSSTYHCVRVCLKRALVSWRGPGTGSLTNHRWKKCACMLSARGGAAGSLLNPPKENSMLIEEQSYALALTPRGRRASAWIWLHSRTIRRTIVSVILFWGSLTEHAGNAQISRGNNPWGNAGFNGPSEPLAETHRRGPRNEASHHAFSHSLLVYRGCPRLHGCSVTFVNAKRRSFIFHFSGPHTSKQAHTPFDLFYKAFSRQSS
jgi:hypothetical protein